MPTLQLMLRRFAHMGQFPMVPFRSRFAGKSLPARFTAILLLFVCGVAFGQATGSLKQVEITSNPEFASEIVVNGTRYTAPAVAMIDTSKPATVEIVPAIVLGPGEESRLLLLLLRFGGTNPRDDYFGPDEKKITIADPQNLDRIHLQFQLFVKVIGVADGPGRIDVYPESADSYYSAGRSISFTGIPDPGAVFAGWKAPFTHFGLDSATQRFFQPETVVGRFSIPLVPPAPLIVEGTLPRFRYRSSRNVLEGFLRLTAARAVRPSGISPSCYRSGVFGGFMDVTRNSDVTPIDLRVWVNTLSVDGNHNPNGEYTCSLSVLRRDGGPEIEIPFKVHLGEEVYEEEPEPTDAVAEGVVDAASYRAISLASGSIFSIFGKRLAASTAQAERLPLPETLATTQVRVTSGGQTRIAPLFYVSANQVNFLVPMDLPSGGGFLEVVRDGVAGPPRSVLLETLAPALFTANTNGEGVPAGYAIRVLGGLQERAEIASCPENSPCVPLALPPLDPNEEFYLVLFGTGFRNVNSQKPEAIVGDQVLPVDFAGPHPDFAGLDQVNIKVPLALLGTGPKTVFLRHGGKETNGVTIHF